MKKLLLFLLLTLPTVIQAQLTPEEESRIEELKEIIQSDAHDTTRINAMKEWDNMIFFFDVQQDSALLEQIIDVSEVNLQKELSIEEERFFLIEMASAQDFLGTLYMQYLEFEAALELARSSIENYKKVNVIVGMDGAYINMGNTLYDMGRVKEAIEAYQNGIKLTEYTGNQRFKGNGLLSLGIIYIDLDQPEKAKEYLFKALELSMDSESIGSMETAYLNMGNAYGYLGDNDSARICYELSLMYGEQINDEFTMGTTYHNLGELYTDEGEMDTAFIYLQKGLELRTKFNMQRELIYSYSGISKWYSLKSQDAKAIDYGKMAFENAQKGDKSADLIAAGNALSAAYENAGMIAKALEIYKVVWETEKELLSSDNQQALIEREVEFTYLSNKLQDSLELKKTLEISDAEHKADLQVEAQQRYVLFGGLVLVLVVLGFAYRGYRQKKADNEIITQQKEEVEQQKTVIEEAHKEITDSIAYAKRIQSAILPPMKVIKENLPNSFVMYLPKDVVAGDFYWMEKAGEEILFAAADCTGHGVPGAMVSVVCNNGLNRSVREHGLKEPAQILDKTREIVIQEFEKSEEEVKDGMDIALVSLNGSNNKLKFSGAHNPLWVIRKGATEIEEYKADKQPIGKFEASKPFTAHEVDLNTGDSFYIFSDGYADQFGGDKGKKFKAANLKRLLLSIQDLSMEEQQTKLLNNFNDWKGSLEQLDDVCVIGVRV